MCCNVLWALIVSAIAMSHAGVSISAPIATAAAWSMALLENAANRNDDLLLLRYQLRWWQHAFRSCEPPAASLVALVASRAAAPAQDDMGRTHTECNNEHAGDGALEAQCNECRPTNFPTLPRALLSPIFRLVLGALRSQTHLRTLHAGGQHIYQPSASAAPAVRRRGAHHSQSA